MANNRIIRKVFYIFEMCLSSPLCISGSDSEYTDKDVIRNGEGNVFIPGSSIAGALRAALAKADAEKVMGFSMGEKGAMSRLYISDMLFEGKTTVSVRDGVQLTEGKTVNNKFDMEIIETGAKTKLYMHYVERENDNFDYEKAIKGLISGLECGTIRFGANKNRGFGRLKLTSEYVYRKEVSRETLAESYSFMEDIKNSALYDKEKYSDWKNKEYTDNCYIRMSVPLKLTGGISIRRYSTKPGEPDFEHITCNGKPVIPGSSWNGAIRSTCIKILNMVGCENTQQIINEWFGSTEKSSAIVIGESVIENSVSLPMTRNKINRFDNSTKDGALYTERACFGGNTTLEIMVRKNEGYEAILGLLELVIKDIVKGYVPVGGMVAVGCGIFEANGEISYSEIKTSDYIAALSSVC